jgi:hypothetical protein
MSLRTLLARFRHLLATKLALLTVMAAGIVIPYFSLQRFRPFPPREPLVSPLDALIPFDPAWAPVYLSVCLLVPLFPLLAREREDVFRYVRGILWLCLVCFAFFLLAPMPGPRPDAAGVGGAYGWLVGVDATWNAFPSLHAGLVVFSFLYGWRVVGAELGPRGRRLFVLASLGWAGAILYGTLATKQHWLADLPAAFALAWGAHRLAWRGKARTAAAAGRAPALERLP